MRKLARLGHSSTYRKFVRWRWRSDDDCMDNAQKDPLTMLLDQMEPQDRKVAQEQIDRLAPACGCSEGAAGLLLGVAVMVGLALADVAWLPHGWLRQSMLALGAAMVGAVVGKTLGKARGRYRAYRLTARLAAQPRSTDAVGADVSRDAAPLPARPDLPLIGRSGQGLTGVVRPV
jgi:hypothetical protein